MASTAAAIGRQPVKTRTLSPQKRQRAGRDPHPTRPARQSKPCLRRLRRANLHTTRDDPAFLYVNVTVYERGVFAVDVQFWKGVTDTASGLSFPAITWETGALGRHDGQLGVILAAVERYADRFIEAYLLVNRAACRE